MAKKRRKDKQMDDMRISRKLKEELEDKRKERLSQRSNCAAATFRASDIHECDRYMVYSVLDWNRRAAIDPGLAAIFEAGIREEQSVKRRLLEDCGYTVSQNQKAFVIDKAGKRICTGHIDGIISYQGAAVLLETKSINQNEFRNLSYEYLKTKPLYRKYLRQICVYMGSMNVKEAILVFSDFRKEKIFCYDFVEPFYEDIINRLFTLWRYVENKTYPDRCAYNSELCDLCAFKHICMPDSLQVKESGEILVDAGLLEKLEFLEKNKEGFALYRNISEEVKKAAKCFNAGLVFLADNKQVVKYKVTVKTHIANTIDVKLIPQDIKEKYLKETTRKTIDFEKI
jgi:hypothetical protein